MYAKFIFPITPFLIFLLCMNHVLAQQTERPLFQKGYNLYNTGDMKGAIRVLTESIELEKETSETFLYRSMAYKATGELGLALQDLNKSIMIDSLNAQYIFIRARLLLELDRHEQAFADCHAGIALDDNHMELRILRGKLALDEEEYELAAEDFHYAIILGAERPDIYDMRAQANMALGNWAAVAEDLTILINVYNRRDINVIFSRGVAFYHTAAFYAAIRDFTSVINSNPEVHMAYLYRAKANFCLEHYSNALQDLRLALGIVPGCEDALELKHTIQSILEHRP